VGRQPDSKDLAIPRSHHDAAAIAGELVGEILSRPQAADRDPSSSFSDGTGGVRWAPCRQPSRVPPFHDLAPKTSVFPRSP
jgi:hypothetical protein